MYGFWLQLQAAMFNDNAMYSGGTWTEKNSFQLIMLITAV